MSLTESVTPLKDSKGQAVFDEPWQAQALAMADLLIQSGQLEATDWSKALGIQLDKLQIGKADNETSYYQAVLKALEQLVQENNLLSVEQVKQRDEDWKNAYLSTPHGQPVRLKSAVA